MIKRRIFIIYFIVIIPFMFLATRLMAQELKSPPELESLIKSNFQSCRLLQLRDLNQGLRDYVVTNFLASSPGYIIADFNGDKLLDYATLLLCEGEMKSNIRFVVFMANKDRSYSCLEINKWTEELYLNNLYLRIAKPGRIREWDSERVFTIEHSSISLVLFEAASRIYYWKEGKFAYIQTSD